MSNELDDLLAESTGDDLEVDFSGASSGDFELLPNGDYTATVTEATPGVSKANNPKITVKWRIDGPTHEGRVLFTHPVTKGKGSGILKDTLRGLGFDVEKLTKLNPQALVGKQCIITVGVQKDNADFNEVKKFKPVPAAGLSI